MQTDQYQDLIQQIGGLLSLGRQKAVQSVNTILVQTYWQIGRHIVEFEQKGNGRAEYGSQLFERLSKDLTQLYGKGFSRSNLLYMRKLYNSFPISETLSHILTWSHYFEILKADSDLEIQFYSKQAENEKWSVRELKRNMKSLLFQRIAVSKDKDGILELAKEGHQITKAEDLIKDPFVLEFLSAHTKTKLWWNTQQTASPTKYYSVNTNSICSKGKIFSICWKINFKPHGTLRTNT